MGELLVSTTSPDMAFIGCLVMLLNVFLFLFLAYIFPFFIFFLAGRNLYGKARAAALFVLSFVMTICLAFLAAYTISFDTILSAISASFIIYTITGLALITGYSVFEQKYPKEHKWIPYIIASAAGAAYMIHYFGFQLKNPCNIHSYILVNATGVENVFHSVYASSGLFPDYYGNFSLWISYFGYYLEVLAIGVVIFFVMSVLMGRIFRM